MSKWVLFGPTKRRVPLQKEHTSMLGMSTPGKIGTVAEAGSERWPSVAFTLAASLSACSKTSWLSSAKERLAMGVSAQTAC